FTITALVMLWASHIILTNASWQSAVGLSVGFLVCFRILFALFFSVIDLLSHPPPISWRILFLTSLWEVATTAAAIGIILAIRSLARGTKYSAP
ncbi:MAG: hypothetical protein AAB932_03150, partial [Patescibacteria group bacterium]